MRAKHTAPLKSVGAPPDGANNDDTPTNHADIKISPNSNRPMPSRLEAVILMAGARQPLRCVPISISGLNGF